MFATRKNLFGSGMSALYAEREDDYLVSTGENRTVAWINRLRGWRNGDGDATNGDTNKVEQDGNFRRAM